MQTSYKIIETKLPFNNNLTILDFETANRLDEVGWDHRKLSVSIVGIIKGSRVTQILRIKNKDENDFKKESLEVINDIKTDIYSFNEKMERGCLEGYFKRIREIREIMPFRGAGASKNNFHLTLKNKNRVFHPLIQEMLDPFKGDSLKCVEEWNEENYEPCLQHNLFCLLSELNILQHKQFLVDLFNEYLEPPKEDGTIWLKEEVDFQGILSKRGIIS